MILHQLILICLLITLFYSTLYGIRRIEGFIRECSANNTRDCYILKLDIRGYFMGIDRRLLRDRLTGLVNESVRGSSGSNPFGTDPGLLLYLIGKILDDDPRDGCRVKGPAENWKGLPPTKSLFHARKGCGLPIGNLTSQLFSNVYLHPGKIYLQHYTKGVDFLGATLKP
jgi:hypothetical protein